MVASVSVFCALIVKRIGSLICPHNRLRCFRGNVKPDYSTKSFAIVGVAESDYGRVPNMTEMQLHAQAIWRALDDSGLRKNDIDAVFCSSHSLGMPTVMLCEYLQMFPHYTDTTSIGGSSFEAHLNHAVAAIRAGKCDVALITYASTQLSSRGRMIGTGARPATTPLENRIFSLSLFSRIEVAASSSFR